MKPMAITLVAAIEAAKAQQAILRIGASGAVAVSWGNEYLGEARGLKRVVADQLRHSVRIQPGKDHLLIPPRPARNL